MAFTKVGETNKTRPSGRNCLMVFGYEDAALATIESIRKEIGIDEIIPLKTGRLGNTLAEILENEPLEKPYEKEIPGPIGVFSAVSDYELNTFLNRFRESGLKKALFAVVTPTSRNWRFGDLASELARERKAMSKGK